MLALWSAGGEYAIQDLAIFALTAVVGLVVILVMLWLWSSPPKPEIKSGKEPARWKEEPANKETGDLEEMGAKGSPHEYLYHLHDKGHCPVTSFWWGKEHVVSVCSPQAFKDTVKLTDRPGQLFMSFAPFIGENSIQYANGTDWENRRRCLYGVFKGENLQSYFPHFVQIAQEVEETWAAGGTEEKIPLLKTSFAMTIKGISRCIFGKTFDDPTQVSNLTEAYFAVAEEMEIRVKEGVDPPETSERETNFQKNRQFMRDVVKRVLRQRREGEEEREEHVPFIDNLLQSGVPEEQALDDSFVFMVGGFHTSGGFLTWLLWYLANHPEVQDKVVEELERETGGECGERLKTYALEVATTYNTYFRQVEDETLRISTIAPWAARVSSEDLTVDGCHVPAGTPIVQALGVGLKNETTWQEGELEEFNPDRFAPGSPHARRGLEFCPFGTPSRRKCPGYIFTHFETTIMAAILLRRFQMVPVPNQKVERDHGMVTMPKNELFITVKER